MTVSTILSVAVLICGCAWCAGLLRVILESEPAPARPDYRQLQADLLMAHSESLSGDSHRRLVSACRRDVDDRMWHLGLRAAEAHYYQNRFRALWDGEVAA